jgi:site-specific DNA-methyltransferase (adenine-specific)
VNSPFHPLLCVCDVEHGLRHIGETVPGWGSVDVIVTSPPYNLGKDYGPSVNDKKKDAHYLDWCRRWGKLLRSVARDDASFFLNLGGTPKDPLMPFRVLEQMFPHWQLQNMIHWVKSVAVEEPGGKEVTRGHFKPVNSTKYLNNCQEFVFHLTPAGNNVIDRLAAGTSYTDESNVRRWSTGKATRCRGNVWHCPYETIQSRDKQRPHPAVFPVKLARRCVLLHGDTPGRTRIVLDPFMGIGSTWVAVDGMPDTRFVGIDINQDFVNEAHRRVTGRPMK